MNNQPVWATRVEVLLQRLIVQVERLVEQVGKQNKAFNNEATQINAWVQQIIELLTPAPPPTPGPAVSFQITVTKGDEMAKAAKLGKMKIDILGNGKALASITSVVDASGLPAVLEAGTVLTYISEATVGAGQDAGIVLTPAADGMSCGIAPSVPPVLVSGDTLTVTAVQPTLGTLVETYNPVNVVAGPANTFVVSVQ